jgi:hypothetical protein
LDLTENVAVLFGLNLHFFWQRKSFFFFSWSLFSRRGTNLDKIRPVFKSPLTLSRHVQHDTRRTLGISLILHRLSSHMI